MLFLGVLKHVAETADGDEERDLVKTVKRTSWSAKSEIFERETQASSLILVSLTILVANLNNFAYGPSEDPFIVELWSPDRHRGFL